jgi:hypothetical protein
MHIDVAVLTLGTGEELWRFTRFYDESKRELSYRSWDCQRLLSGMSNLPWLCTRDFNEVLEAFEHFGSQERSERQMEGFREAVADYGFLDLGFSGLPYTWDNWQGESENVKVRLDRVFCDNPPRKIPYYRLRPIHFGH